MQEAFFLALRVWAGAYIVSNAFDKVLRLKSAAARMWRPSYISIRTFRKTVGIVSLLEGLYVAILIAVTDHTHLLMIASVTIIGLLTCYGTISIMKIGHCGCALSDPAPKKERLTRTALLLLRNIALLMMIVLSVQFGAAPMTLIRRNNDLGGAALTLALLPVVYLIANKCWRQLEATVADGLRFRASRLARAGSQPE